MLKRIKRKALAGNRRWRRYMRGVQSPWGPSVFDRFNDLAFESINGGATKALIHKHWSYFCPRSTMVNPVTITANNTWFHMSGLAR